MHDSVAFESRLEDAFARFLEAAPTTVEPAALAAHVLRGGPASRGIRGVARPFFGTRLVWVGVLAAVVAGLLIAGGGGLLHGPVPTGTPTASAPRSTEPQSARPSSPISQAGPWTAVYARVSADNAAVEIVTVTVDGRERTVRSLPRTGTDGDGVAAAGLVSRNGWAFLYWQGYEASGEGPITIFDLDQPSRQPTLVKFGAPLGPRWSADGLLAIPGFNAPGSSRGPEEWAVITVLDPRGGTTQSLGQVSLFGGGPSIVWASDGSGIWDGGMLRLMSGRRAPIRPDQLFLDRRVGAGGSAASDRGMYAADGKAFLSATHGVSNGRDIAVVTRVDGDGVETLAEWPLPEGAFDPRLGNPDPADTQFPIYYSTGSEGNPAFIEGPIVHPDGTTTGVTGGFLMGWVPAVLADRW
jgi:hypothetical protein